MIRKSDLRILRACLRDCDDKATHRLHRRWKSHGGVYRYLIKEGFIVLSLALGGAYYITELGRKVVADAAGRDDTSRGCLRRLGRCMDCDRPGAHLVVRGETPAYQVREAAKYPLARRAIVGNSEVLALRCDVCRRAKYLAER